MSVTKLLSRVVSSEDDDESNNYKKRIKSDALIQLVSTDILLLDFVTWEQGFTNLRSWIAQAIIFSALIHDVDHLGVPNIQLAKEKPDFAAKYENKSIAENNSINIAWEIFLKPDFSAFRQCVAPCTKYLERFHATVVNVTLATDIVDKELKADRNARWDHAFSESAGDERDELKVRIVLEHLIQASDVCHTMQHWHVYRKWNERLFMEMYKAYCEGRAASNPAEFWYKGEIGFFDFCELFFAKCISRHRVCNTFRINLSLTAHFNHWFLDATYEFHFSSKDILPLSKKLKVCACVSVNFLIPIVLPLQGLLFQSGFNRNVRYLVWARMSIVSTPRKTGQNGLLRVRRLSKPW